MYFKWYFYNVFYALLFFFLYHCLVLLNSLVINIVFGGIKNLALSVHLLYLKNCHTWMHLRKFYSRPDLSIIVGFRIVWFREKIVIESKHGQFFHLIRRHDVLFHPFKNRIQELTFSLHYQTVKLGTDNFKNSLLIFEEVYSYVFIIVA